MKKEYVQGLICISLLLLIFLAPLILLPLNRAYFTSEVNKYAVAENVRGISSQELAENLVNYLKGDSELAQAYTDAEASHMEDVKKLFDVAKILIIIALVIIVAMLLAAFILGYALVSLIMKPLRYAAIIALILCIIILVYALVDFNSFFILFHEILFPQGNYAFPANSTLKTLMPNELFSEVATHIYLLEMFLGAALLSITFIPSLSRDD